MVTSLLTCGHVVTLQIRASSCGPEFKSDVTMVAYMNLNVRKTLRRSTPRSCRNKLNKMKNVEDIIGQIGLVQLSSHYSKCNNRSSLFI